MQHALIERALSVPPSPSPGPRPPTALFDAQGTATRFWLRGFTYHAESCDDDDRTTDLFLGIDAIARDLQQRLAAATLRRLGNTEVIVEKDLSNLDPTRLHVYIEGLLNRPVL